MFQDFLLELSRVSVSINGRIDTNKEQVVNTMIFGNNFSGDVFSYKKTYFKKLRKKELQLLKIQERIYSEELTDRERTILLQETENRLLKLEFLRYIYNTEAQKIDLRMQVYYPYSIEIYNKAFFGVTQKDIGKPITVDNCRSYPNIYKKSDILHLIQRAKIYCPELEFQFGKFANFSHISRVLRIPNQKYYNIQNIITLFFHETTHFFRTLNTERNLGFGFRFAGYSSLEEGIAIHNEYYYGNKICDYGHFIPYYNLCIGVLTGEGSEAEKKDKIYKILSCKGFDRERTDSYYLRFYKYCTLGGTHLFLKDLIYNNGYKNVRKLIRKSPDNYEKIMAGDIGVKELEQELVTPENNFNTRLFFQKMLKEIKTLQLTHQYEK